MTAATSSEQSSTSSVSPTRPSTTAATTTENVRKEVDEKDSATNLKDLLRSGKHGNDPAKIKEMLKNFKKTEDEGENSDAGSDQVGKPRIFF